MENKIANINDDINNICIVLSNMDEYNIKKFKIYFTILILT